MRHSLMIANWKECADTVLDFNTSIPALFTQNMNSMLSKIGQAPQLACHETSLLFIFESNETCDKSIKSYLISSGKAFSPINSTILDNLMEKQRLVCFSISHCSQTNRQKAWVPSAWTACQQTNDLPTLREVTASSCALIDWQFSKVCQLQAWTFPPSEKVTEREVNTHRQASGSH